MNGNLHLNLFHFFSDRDNPHYENNLSRAFALCLKHDHVFLNNVLRELLPTDFYKKTFSTDYPENRIKVDLQKRAEELAGFEQVIAIASTGSQLDVAEAEMDSISGHQTENPVTDVAIEVNNLCMIFEFKPNGSDCRAQLKGQAEKIRELSENENSESQFQITYRDLSWPKIVRLALNALSFQRQVQQENYFTRDFVEFLQMRHPAWFPKRLLGNIPYPKDHSDPNAYYLSDRLDQIKTQIYDKDQMEQIGGRFVIKKDFGWANEVHLDDFWDDDDNKYLVLKIFPGDTKAQGRHFYQPGKTYNPPRQIEGFELRPEWYLKLSHFNSGVSWIILDEDQRRITHEYTWFRDMAGRWYKDKREWEKFKKEMDSIVPNWKGQERCQWEDRFENSNRTYFDLSIGVRLDLLIPYEEAQKMDTSQANSPLAKKLKSCIEQIQASINRNQLESAD